VKEAIRVGSVDIAVARDSYWAAAPATHLRDRKQPYSQINDAFLDQVFNMPVSLYPAMSLRHSTIHGVRYNLLPGLVYADAWKG
jgi:hypothetical protein